MARPAIRCFSTDLPPLGCDVVHQPVAPAIGEMLVDSGCHTCSSLTHHARRFDLAPSGPCDCHVQDIACLGCGNVVGYYIHRPCFRCLAQRLRIKQRGFQHLWTFYQDNVFALPRENDYGDPVGWEELPSPPAPSATTLRRAPPEQIAPAPTATATDPAQLIESPPTSALAPSQGHRDAPPSINMAARSFGEALAIAPSSADSEQSHRSSARRAHWLNFMSQRVAAERILHNPRASREARQEAMRTLAALREQEWDSISRNTANGNSSSTEPAAASSPPPRPSTQTLTVSRHHTTPTTTAAVSVAFASRRDEVMEPLCPPPKLKPLNVLPPAGLSNWLFQVGLDCMVKWEEISLSR
ncbi:Crossover junction endonuclease mus81 [Coemansia thaxteri]|nr:Crossover junction endonuclease mus81 [Coemansia thaxteri]KAJ2332904.1 Crossover junction endonuclease mus81 [Coemansia sp. RSA 2673]KAJ2474466.1 Crossover junction endonuclease mus81 [Coemansia sp. RSA 2322]